MFSVKVVVVFVAFAFLYWAGWVWATLPFGSDLFLGLAFILPIGSLIAAGVAVVALVGLVNKRFRSRAVRMLAISAAIVAGSALGIWVGRTHKMARIREVVSTEKPLIRAIESFEQKEGRPPRDLNELVPKYVPELPSTGMGGYSEWEYLTGTDARDLYEGNSWVLVIHTGGPGINFDKLLFFPNQRYPEIGHGGWIERIGRWGYVHE